MENKEVQTVNLKRKSDENFTDTLDAKNLVAESDSKQNTEQTPTDDHNAELDEPKKPTTLHEYFEINMEYVKGIPFPHNYRRELEEIEKLDAYNDDIWVCSFPRSGTTLTQELVYLVQTLDFDTANSVHLDKRFPIIELKDEKYPHFRGVEGIKELTSPRFIKSHLPHFMLPEQLRKGHGKIIYTSRNVRDMLWSLFRFTAFLGHTDFCQIQEYFDYFIAGKVIYGPWGAHIRAFWEHRNDENVLFLRYEETIKDMPGAIKKVAKFLDRTLSEEDVSKICEHCSIENMRTNPMTNFDYAHQYKQFKKGFGSLINAGGSGSWRGHYTEDMHRRIDEMVEEYFAGSGLTFDKPSY